MNGNVFYTGEMQYRTWVTGIISSDWLHDPLSVIEKAHSRVLHIRSDDRADGPAIAPRLITSISPFPSPLPASSKGRYWVSSHPLLAQCVPTASPSLYANRTFFIWILSGLDFFLLLRQPVLRIGSASTYYQWIQRTIEYEYNEYSSMYSLVLRVGILRT